MEFQGSQHTPTCPHNSYGRFVRFGDSSDAAGQNEDGRRSQGMREKDEKEEESMRRGVRTSIRITKQTNEGHV